MEAQAQAPLDLVEAFLRQSRLTPNLAAVDQKTDQITYHELASKAFQIAGSIQRANAGISPRVLLALPPSSQAYAGMMGTLIAGGTFCPIDIWGPEGRNAAVCRAFSPDVVLFSEIPPPFLDNLPVTTPRVDVAHPCGITPESPAAERSEVAYVIFTSGSTGRPKGVKIGRRSFSYFLGIASRFFNLTPGERWSQFSNLGHDLGVMDVFMSLSQGGTLVPLDQAERLRPATAIRERRISIWQSVPSVVELMLRAKHLTAEYLKPLRVMSFCGEPLHPNQLAALFKACPELLVFNTYGATETIGFNTINCLTAGNYTASCEAGAVSIGDDVAGWTLHLRGGASDNEGEIVIASDFLSLGYWQDEERTRACFRQVIFSESRSERVYFTGDRGVRRGKRIYCSGRLDRQVKIRGERIELDEVDGQLREAGFQAAYTILCDGELHSFVESIEEVDQERVRHLLGRSLPFHAIPKNVHSLPSLPRNSNGKIDREALKRLLIS